MAALGTPSRVRGAARLVRRAARAHSEHARHRAAEGARGAGGAAAPPALPADALNGQIYRDSFYEPYAAWYPELPRPVYVGLLFTAAVAAVAISVGLLTRLATADDVPDRDLQPLPLHHALPQQPRVPGDRARRARVRGARPGAVTGRLAAPPPRPSSARPLRARMAAVAAPVRMRRGVRGVRAEQAARPGLVRRHRHLAARGARPRRAGGVAAA